MHAIRLRWFTHAVPLTLLSLLLPAGCDERPLTAPMVPEEPAFVVAASVSAGVVISQVFGGGGNAGAPYTHDFVELFNRGSASVSLTGLSVQYASAAGTGNFGANPIAALSGTLAAGQYYLVQLAGGVNGSSLPTPNATGTANMSATAGKVALVNSTTGLACNGGSAPCSAAQLALIVDLVGFGSTANFFEGSAAAPTLSNTTAALRAAGGCTDTDDNSNDLSTGAPAPRNMAASLNVCGDAAPSVASTSPANGAVGVAADAAITVAFSEPVNVAGDWFGITCTASGAVSATVSEGPTSFTLDPDVALQAGESCTVTILATAVSDQDADDPPDTMAANHAWSFTVASGACAGPYTPIYAIQGSGSAAAITGMVTTRGVVVGDYEGPAPALRGFYLQDETGDGDPATSDAIFVFDASNGDHVTLGDVVRVSGTAAEFQGQTQLSASLIMACGTGTVSPVDVSLPFPSADYAERYEGMLVRLPQTLYVTEHFQLGRFGQVVLSSSDRLYQPTQVATPAGAAAVQAQNGLNRIILDDELNNQNPDPIRFGRGGSPLSAANTLRGGDQVTGLVGVLTYTWAGNAASGNAYRIRPVGALGGGVPNFIAANPRPAAPQTVGGTLKVGTLNLLNYFNTFTGCTDGVGGATASCRGANTSTEFERQAAKTVAAIAALQADVVGIVEIENDGYGPASAIQDLVNRLNATSSGPYAFIDVDAATSQSNALGIDGIKVGLLYRPASVTPVGSTAVLNTVAFVNAGDGTLRNRPALAQAFQDRDGGRFVVSVNHLKSKGSACDAPDAADGQGNCNLVRTVAAQLLRDWLAADPTSTGETDVLIMGDLNSYAKEDPITTLVGAGYTDLVASFVGPNAYSYVFDGQWGYIDHALASASLGPQVTGVTQWHMNADEPGVLDYNVEFKSADHLANLYAPDAYRMSDHDPIVVGLNLSPSQPIGGFQPPVAGPPAYNTSKAGSAVPVKFSLGGYRGLDIFAPGSPRSDPIACMMSATSVSTDEAPTAGKSALSYDPATDTYSYIWKTDRSWASTCRVLVLRLTDGSEYRAWFNFSR